MKIFAILLLVASTALAAEPDPAGVTFFEQKVRPVLVEHCYSCHSADAKKLKGNLLLDSKAGWEKGGDNGAAVIVPGKPEESLLLRAVLHTEVGLEMPPEKPKLSDAVIADLRTWIKLGAPDPRDGVKTEAKRADKSWWSLQPLAKELPHDNIDGFIKAKMAEKKLALNPPADPRALIRRMTYDVTGLPPTVEEVEAFTTAHRANAAQATAALVDRLLASPRYGERWARHWLDTIRFGESNGFERNVVIDNLWPFRDYVIKSINDDKPFNQFITEHLAGDVIGSDNPAIEIGSAFLVAGPYDDVGNQDVVAQKNIRAATLDDIITATSGAFLGLTVNCARCHHHKFDPIPTEDYYRLRAAFEGVTHGPRVVTSKVERETHAAALKPLNEQLATLNKELGVLNAAIDARVKAALAEHKPTKPMVDPFGTTEEFPAIEAKQVRLVISAFTNGPAKVAKTARGKLTEFQVWNANDPKENVALASHGTQAAGAKSASSEEFPEAYGPQHCIDGTTGEAWFIGAPPVLTLTFANTEKINRITFMSARGERGEPGADASKVGGDTPCEYEVQVSLDGKTWQTVASDEGRAPWSPAHGLAKARREVLTATDTEQVQRLEKEIAETQAKINRVPALPQVWVGKHAQPKEQTFVHLGGDPLKPGKAVVPASLSVLDQVTKPYELAADANQGQRRLELARWITSDDNALTARVLANRVWQHHFGAGIVDTPSDFGFLGGKPTHPELLDYLAKRLIAHGWKLKPLHREILLSQTYLQSAAFREDAAKQDKDARLLWRFPPRRLSAEEVRDTLLAIAGKLQLEPLGGPGFRLYKFTQNNVCTYLPLDTHDATTYRRAVYHQNARASVVDVLNDFDLPDSALAAPKRANTTTPMQALTLLNHNFTLDMATALAGRAQNGDAVTQVYQLAFQREPSKGEHEAATKLIAAHGVAAFCRALLNANELLYLE
jgi:mono/diheme cytochrome c family protein